MTAPHNVQRAPYPLDLAELVHACSYRAHEGWTVALADAERDHDLDGNVIGRGLTLMIRTEGHDSYHPDRGRSYRVMHYFIVPAATYNRAAWCRWLLERFIDVERHEACEHFIIGDARPFAPTHGPGDDPYVIHEYATDTQRRTKYTGEELPA